MTKFNLEKCKSGNKGITLIALIITIIVLLILAGITISALTGSDSAPAKANEAKQKNDIGAAKDAVAITVQNALTDAYTSAYVDGGSTKGSASTDVGSAVISAVNEKYGTVVPLGLANIKSETKSDGDGQVTIWTTDFEVIGTIDKNGGVLSWGEIGANGGEEQQGGQQQGEEKNWDLIKANATKHASQSQENTDIGIGPNGEAINLDLWEYNIIDGTQTIFLGNDRDYMPDYFDICYNGNMKEDIVLPRSIKKGDTWYDVVEIGIGAFATSIYGQNAPKAEVTITIPDTVTTIDDSAFMYSDYLSYITIPNSVTHIGCQAFDDAEIKELRISNSVESWESTYNSGSNGGTFPGIKVETLYMDCDLPDYGFDQAYINELILGDNCTSFGENPLNCSIAKVTINCDIPDSLFDQKSLEEVTIGNNCTEIGESAFSNCSDLQTVNLPNNLITIGNNAFSGCGSLTSITIPSGVTSIGSGAFDGCSSIETITIPNGIERLNYLGYMNEAAVINLPSTITHIYYMPFYDGVTVNYAGTRDQWNDIKLMDENGDEVSVGYELYIDNVTIHCSDD